MKIIDEKRSEDGSIKYCLKTEDNKLIETVYIPGKEKVKICVSTQIGCEFNCKHCATATIKFERRLKFYEIYEQVMICLANNYAEKPIDIMFYGMGEPITNLDEIVKAVDLIKKNVKLVSTNEQFYISTSGVKGGIDDLLKKFKDCNLAISLHSAIQEKREQLIPHGKVYNLSNLKEDIIKYEKITNNKKIIIHYCLIKGFNDDVESKEKLIEFAKEFNCQIDVIPFNEFDNCIYTRPSDEETNKFVSDITEQNIEISFRPSKSRDIGGGCGQLVAKLK